MAPIPDNTPRKAHDLHTKIEEEDLWDLDDDWDDDDEATPEHTREVSSDDAGQPEANVTPEPEEPEDLTEPEPEPEPETGESRPANVSEDDQFDLNEDSGELEELELEYDDEPADEVSEDSKEESESEPPTETADSGDTEPEDTTPLDTATEDEAADDAEEESAELAEPTEAEPATAEETASLVEPLKKLGLKPVEKIALSLIALLFIGITVWGIVWLKQKNNIAKTDNELTFPMAGNYATVGAFSTYWKTPGDTPGINNEAVIVPAASITLADGSSSGALRVFFRNTAKESIGDTITVVFKNGTFTNGEKTIEVSATDGFHLKGDFHAYQMDDSQAWEVEVLEAENASVPRSSFKTIINTTMSPTLR